MKKLKLIGDSILAYMPKDKLKGIEERHTIENAETALLRKLYPKYKDSKADINIFCLGINDFFRQYYYEDFPRMTAEDVAKGLTEFIGQIKQDNNGEIVVLSLLPIRQTRSWSGYYPVINRQIPVVNEKLQDYCKKENIRFVDAHSHFVDSNGVMREELSDDGVHPNSSFGYNVLASLINTEIVNIEQQEEIDFWEHN